MTIHGRNRTLVLAAMSLLYFLLTAGTFDALGVTLPRMVPALGMNWGQAGAGFALLGLACGLASLLPAVTIRRLGLRATLLLGGALLGGGFATMAGAQGATAYQAGAVLLGIGYCFLGTVPGVHIVSGAFENRAASALGLYFTIGGLGAVAGPLAFSAFDLGGAGWRLFWAALAVSAAVLALFAAAVVGGARATPVGTGAPLAGWQARAALRAPQFWLVVAAYTGALLINTTMHSFSVQHMTERGLPLARAAWLTSASALIAAAASALAGYAGERVSGRSLTLAALGALAVAMAALALPQGVATLALFAIAIGLGLGFSYVGTAMMLIDWFGRRPNLELYATMCVVSTLAAAGPAVGGRVRDATGSFAGVFAALAGIGLVLFLAVVLTPRPAARSVADQAR